MDRIKDVTHFIMYEGKKMVMAVDRAGKRTGFGMDWEDNCSRIDRYAPK